MVDTIRSTSRPRAKSNPQRSLEFTFGYKRTQTVDRNLDLSPLKISQSTKAQTSNSTPKKLFRKSPSYTPSDNNISNYSTQNTNNSPNFMNFNISKNTTQNYLENSESNSIESGLISSQRSQTKIYHNSEESIKQSPTDERAYLNPQLKYLHQSHKQKNLKPNILNMANGVVGNIFDKPHLTLDKLKVKLNVNPEIKIIDQPIKLENDAYFNGTIDQGMPKSGTLVYRGKYMYEGKFEKGLAHGQNGKYIDYTDNSTHIGDFYQGKKHGPGQWIKRKKIDFQEYQIKEKDVKQSDSPMKRSNYKRSNSENKSNNKLEIIEQQTGRWSRGSFRGGEYIGQDGYIYNGEFKHNYLHGKNCYVNTYDRKRVYKGQMFNGEKHGFGEEYLENSGYYRGNFLKNERSGVGCLVQPDQHYYFGIWKKGRQTKQGNEVREGEHEFQGTFKDGQRYEGIEKDLKTGKSYRVEEGKRVLEYTVELDLENDWKSKKMRVLKQNQSMWKKGYRAPRSCSVKQR